MKIGDARDIKVGSTSVSRVMFNGQQIWPTDFYATITVSWRYNNQTYTVLPTMPASGGEALATWKLHIFRASDSREVETATIYPLANQVSVSDGTNFPYDASTRKWKANDRARNGLTAASGEAAPTSISTTRSSTISITNYQITYRNKLIVPTFETQTMTQAKNEAHPASPRYGTVTLTISAYGDAAHAAPASETTVRLTAQMDKSTLYTFDSNSTYDYLQPGSIKTDRFNFSVPADGSWVTFSNKSSSGITATLASRGTDNLGPRSTSITATSIDDATKHGSIGVFQQSNFRQLVSTVLISYSVMLAKQTTDEPHDTISIDATEQYVYLFGVAEYRDTYSWPSGHPNTIEDREQDQNPTAITTSPSVPSGNIEVANRRVKIPANTGLSRADYTITGKYTYGGVEKSDTATVNQQFVPLSYGTLAVIRLEYDTIPAYGGTVKPSFRVTLELMQGTTRLGYLTGDKTDSQDISQLTISNSTYSVSQTVNLSYYVNNASASYGAVSAGSRGYNEDAQDTVAASNCYVHASIAALNKTADSSSVSVMQQANGKRLVSTVLSGYAVSLSQDSIGETGGYITVYGTATYTKTWSWTSLAPNTYTYPSYSEYPTGISTDPDVGSSNIEVDNHRVMIPANTSTRRTFTITGEYTDGGVTKSGSEDVTQAANTYTYGNPTVTASIQKIDDEGDYPYHIPASGGTVYPVIHVKQLATPAVGRSFYIEFDVPEGTTSGTYNGYSYTVSYTGGTGSLASKGAVYAASKGTNPDTATDPTVVTSTFRATVSINGKSGQSSALTVRQQLNHAEPFDAYDVYYGFSIERFRQNSSSGSEITLIRTAATTTVFVETKAQWEHFFAGVDYTSGEHTGGGSEYHNEVVTPGYLSVTGATGGYNTSTFTADNKHNTTSKQYTVSASYQGMSTGNSYISQVSDSKVTGQTKDYAATLSVTDNCWPGGGSATVIVYATHTEYSKWASDNTEVSGSATTKYDTATVFTEEGTSSRFHLGSRGSKRSDGGYPYTVTHDDMTTNAATDSLVLRGRNEAQTSATSTQYRKTVRNSLRTSGTGIPAISYGSWSLGTNYNDNYRITSFLVDDYTSSDSAASFLGATTNFSVTAAHSVLRDDTRDKYTDYYYESAYGSDYGYSDQKDANHRSRTTTTDTRTVTVTQTVTGDSVNVSYSYGASSWLSANTSTGKITISAQSTTGSARNGTIYMQNAGGGGTWPATIYQYGYASIAASVDSLNFAAGGGTKTFTITTKYATWTLSYDKPQPVSSPISSVSPESGGSLSLSSKTTTVYVTASANDGADMKIANITITGTAPGLSETIKIRVSQTALSV